MIALRPWEGPNDDDEDRFSFFVAGSELDHAKVASSREELLKSFYETTTRTDVEFGDLIWISNYRPNIRMVDKFGEGRIFVAGG